MARLSSQLDMEYVPTDHHVVWQIAEKFKDGLAHYSNDKLYESEERNYVNIFDPCAGEGKAVAYLAHLLGKQIGIEDSNRRRYEDVDVVDGGIVTPQTFGVELESERYKLARKALDKVIEADFLNTMVEPDWFDVLFLNPPYDYDPDFKKLEHRFLVRATGLLKRNGVLIYIVPRSTLKISADFLAANYRRFNIWDPGHEDGRRYNQVVLMACRNYEAVSYAAAPSFQQSDLDDILGFASGEISEVKTDDRRLGSDNLLGAYGISLSTSAAPSPFTPIAVDYEAALSEMDVRGLQSGSKWRDMTTPGRLAAIRPLMPQLTGHIAQMLAANVLSEGGVALMSEEGERLLLKISATKVASVSYEGDGGSDSSAKVITEKLEQRAALLSLSEWAHIDDFDVNEIIYKHRNALAEYINRQMPPLYNPTLMDRPDYSRLLRRPLPGNAQRLAIEALIFGLTYGDRKNDEDADDKRGKDGRRLSSIILNAEMGTGKTYVSMVGGFFAGKRRTLVVCPPNIVSKWRDEIRATIPNARVYIVGEVEKDRSEKREFYARYSDRMWQLDWLRDRYGDAYENDPVYVIVSHSKAKGSFSRMPAVIWRRGYRPQPRYLENGGVFHPPFVKFVRPADDDAPERDAVEEGGKQPLEMWMCCPTCYQPILDKESKPVTWEWLCKAWRECPNEITVGVDEVNVRGFVHYETNTRRCGAPLWQAYARNEVSGVDTGIGVRGQLRDRMRNKFMFAYDAVSVRGVDRDRFGEYVPSLAAQIKANGMRLLKRDGVLPPRRLELASYIKRSMPDFFDFLIMDEVHQYKSKTSVQGRLAGVLANVVPQRVALTGTLMAGYAEDLFRVLYHFGPKSLRADFGHKDVHRWNDVYGFVERRILFRDRSDSLISKTRGVRTQDRNLPGALPGVLRYVLPSSVFIQLKDVVADLPPFREFHVSVPMSDDVTDYAEFQKSQSDVYTEVLDRMLAERQRLVDMEEDYRGATQIVSLFAQISQVYPEVCMRPEGFKVEHPAGGGYLLDYPPLRADKLYPKEEKLIELCDKERKAGRRVLVYVAHTQKYDVQERIAEVLKAEGFRVRIMRSKDVSPSQRVRWISDRVREGVEVLICFSGLVEVGVDLLDFPTIIWYEVDYQTARVRQASRRSWRIGQTEPVNVYYLTYAASKQTQALYLVSQKVRASLAIEGNVTRDGLAGVDNSDISGQSIARMLVESGLDNTGGFESKIRFASDGDVHEMAGELVVTDHDVWDLEAYETDGGITADVVDALTELELMDDAPDDGVIDGVVLSVDDVALAPSSSMGEKSSASAVLIEEPLGLDVNDRGGVDLSDWAVAFGMKVDDYRETKRRKRR